jgi:Domain of unknown function (DUF222)
VGREHDSCDITTVWGRLYATDAGVLKRRLTAMAHSVCDADPRTMAQRRADALGALAAGAQRLACTCGRPDCASAGSDGRASNVVIHVVTEAGALDAAPDPQMSGEIQTTRRAVTPQRDLDAPSGAQPTPPAGLLLRGGMVPAPRVGGTRRVLRSGPYDPLPDRADARVQLEVHVPKTSPNNYVPTCRNVAS